MKKWVVRKIKLESCFKTRGGGGIWYRTFLKQESVWCTVCLVLSVAALFCDKAFFAHLSIFCLNPLLLNSGSQLVQLQDQLNLSTTSATFGPVKCFFINVSEKLTSQEPLS